MSMHIDTRITYIHKLQICAYIYIHGHVYMYAYIFHCVCKQVYLGICAFVCGYVCVCVSVCMHTLACFYQASIWGPRPELDTFLQPVKKAR